MKARPQISVVLPVRNGLPALREAVASIRAQTFAAWELLAIDDGSTDGSGAWLEGCAATEPRMRVRREAAVGLVAALNLGVALARGEWIARLDADDVAHPERLEAQWALVQARPEIGLVGSLVEFGGDRARAGGYARHVDWLNTLVHPEEIALNRFVESPLAHPTVMFYRELTVACGSYRAGDFPEDYELWLRWLEAGVRMAKVPRALVRWNDPPGRLSRVDPRYAAEAFYRCKAKYLARWLKLHVAEDRAIWVWGAGRPTRKRAACLEAHGVRVEGYLDIDPRKIGACYTGRRVVAPEALEGLGPVFVLGYVAKPGARELARAFLTGRGRVEGRDFLMAA